MTTTTTRASVTYLMNPGTQLPEGLFFDLKETPVKSIAVDPKAGTVTALVVWEEKLPMVHATQAAMDWFKHVTFRQIPPATREIVAVNVERVEAE